MRNYGRRNMPGERAARRARRAVGRTSRKAGERLKRDAAKVKEDAKSLGQRIGSAYDATTDYLGGKPTLDALAEQFYVNLDNNRAAEIALRLLPATTAVGSVVGIGNLLFGGESFGNVAMDSLGMGVGAYGINRGINS